MINKHKPTLTFAKSSSIQTVHTLVKCMRSQLVSIAIVTSILKWWGSKSWDTKTNLERKERQDFGKKKYHIMVPNKHRLVDELQYMNTFEN